MLKKLYILVIFCLFSLSANNGHSDKRFEGYVFYNFGVGLPDKGKYDEAVSYQVTVGRQVSPFLAITVNYYGQFFSDADISRVDDDLDDLFSGSKKDVRSAYINLEINKFLPIVSFLEPYIGVGYGREKIKFSTGDGSDPETESSDLVQIYAGVRFKLNKNEGIFGEYRFHRREDEVKDATGGGEEKEAFLDALVEEKENSFLFGYYYAF